MLLFNAERGQGWVPAHRPGSLARQQYIFFPKSQLKYSPGLEPLSGPDGMWSQNAINPEARQYHCITSTYCLSRGRFAGSSLGLAGTVGEPGGEARLENVPALGWGPCRVSTALGSWTAE